MASDWNPTLFNPEGGRVQPNGVVLVSVWFFISAVISLLGVAAILIFAIPALRMNTAVGSDEGHLVVAAVLFGLALLVVFGVADVVAVVGLLRLRAWARWLAIGRAALLLFIIPFGTIIGALIIWYLLTDKAKQAFGAALPQPTPKEPIEAAQSDHP